MEAFREYKILKSPGIARAILPADEALDSISLYLRDIGGHRYLSLEDEKRLFAKLDEAWPSRRSDDPQPPSDEAKSIRAEIAESLMKLVVSIAKKNSRTLNLEFGDLINEGNEGVIRAINKFEPERGFRLTTYATWWIRQAISRAICNLNRNIRIPVHMEDLRKRIKNFEYDYLLLNGDLPDVDQISEAIGEKKEKIYHCLASTQYTQSLDALLEGSMESDPGTDSYSVIAGDEPDYGQPIDLSDLTLLFEEILGEFTPREARIIELRYGLNGEGGRQHTLEECGQKFGITRERVRQIEAGVLRRLRHPKRVRRLKAFLSEDI